MELCRLINSCSYLSFTSSLYLCLFRYTMVFIQKGRNWEAAYYICKICIREKRPVLSKNYITSNHCTLHVIFIPKLLSSSNVVRWTTPYYTSKYLSRNVVQTVVVFAYVSKSEITFSSAVSWHMIILHWIEKVKKNEMKLLSTGRIQLYALLYWYHQCAP